MIINEEKLLWLLKNKNVFRVKDFQILIFLVSFRFILSFFHSNLTEPKYAGFHEKSIEI